MRRKRSATGRGGRLVGRVGALQGVDGNRAQLADVLLHVVNSAVDVVEATVDIVDSSVEVEPLPQHQAADGDHGRDDRLGVAGQAGSVALFGIAVCVAGLAAATPAAGQGIRSVQAGDQAITVLTQVRHTTTVVLPQSETIVDVVAGDADYWDVTSASNVAYIKPLEEDVASNVTLVGASGRVWALLVAEADEEPDLVVHVDAGQRRALREAAAPAFVAGGALAAQRAEEDAAHAERRALDEAAARDVAAAWAEHDGAWSEWLADYPRRLRFPYRLEPEAFGPPFHVEALWHDGRFTYLRSRAQETPALYELQEADRRFGRTGLDPALVAYEVFDDGLYVADHVLGPGRLQIGDSQTEWSIGRAGRREWTPVARAVFGGMVSAVALVLAGGVGR